MRAGRCLERLGKIQKGSSGRGKSIFFVIGAKSGRFVFISRFRYPCYAS